MVKRKPDPVAQLRRYVERLVDVVSLQQHAHEQQYAGTVIVVDALRAYVDTLDDYVRALDARIRILEAAAAARADAAPPAARVH